ncbi:hypothetical protein C0J52_01150 [Blattella germanica]|nr:hypothetical protein C0J52_01150 [Blattella germanica]
MLKYLNMMLFWVLVLLFCSHSLCDTNDDMKCEKISGCRCVFPTGLGVDLSAVNAEALWLNVSMVNATFFFHPCSDLPFGEHTGEDDCTKGASQFKLQSRWPCPMPIVTRSSSISDVSSGGLSTGSVLVIIFFVFVAIYFIGGAIALKLLRGAEGREMIPNYDFWADLPNLVRDGTVFMFSGCQSTPTYDRI